MSTNPRNPTEETVLPRNADPMSATETKSASIDHPLLFHPLCAERLETAIECNLERLAAALRVAVSDVEKSLSTLAQNSTILEPNEAVKLTAALRQGLEALNRIQVSSGVIGSSLKEHIETINESMSVILESSKKIQSHREIKRLIFVIDREIKSKKISTKKREILEAQRAVLQSALNEQLDRWEHLTE